MERAATHLSHPGWAPQEMEAGIKHQALRIQHRGPNERKHYRNYSWREKERERKRERGERKRRGKARRERRQPVVRDTKGSAGVFPVGNLGLWDIGVGRERARDFQIARFPPLITASMGLFSLSWLFRKHLISLAHHA